MAANDDSRNAGGDNNDVRYFDSDFSFEEHAAECAALWQTSSGGCEDETDVFPNNLAEEDENESDDDDLLPGSQSRVWDAFHSNHSAGNFYKPRRYLTKSFPCILQYFEHGDTAATSSRDGDGDAGSRADDVDDDRILLEIGCGSGSSCIPIIKRCSEMDHGFEGGAKRKRVLLACDSSPVAVETTRRFVERMMGEDGVAKPRDFAFGAFVADPSLNEEESSVTFRQEVKSAYRRLVSFEKLSKDLEPCNSDNDGGISCDGGIAGVVMMVFVLSAVTPSRAAQFLEQVYQTTKPEGKVCFRDYGLYDMPMLRFSAAARKSAPPEDPVFVRGEGTIARFFSTVATKELFESAGFSTLELRYCTVYNHNRKTGQKLKRVFIHGVFEKPL